jgi:DMSO/TMAO reductase YedYZ molybdopterin-dependent catalytic subunit
VKTTAVGRRVFFGMAGVGAAGILFGSNVQRVIGNVLSPLTAGGGALASLIPGGDTFRIYTITGFLPQVAPSQYRLQIGGLVDKPMTLSLADLQSLPRTQLVRPFQCVTGWRVPNVHWEGVQLSHLLDAAGVKPQAKAISFTSFDGAYTESLTLDQALRPDVIVADRMLGGPVTTEHGGPVRMYIAPMYGYKSTKWLSGIQLVDNVMPGYWEQNGYDVDAWVGRSNGRTDVPIT